jgi:hypothetical protein
MTNGDRLIEKRGEPIPLSKPPVRPPEPKPPAEPPKK